ncbi:hypothetical protein KEM56_002529 [Ascosphaera pollenicola]|nr:hypothetical protein KEM56_002529 [Ascosphaera pollenicola]
MSSTQEAAFLRAKRAAVATAVPATVTVTIAGEKETRKIPIELVNTLKKIAQRTWGSFEERTISLFARETKILSNNNKCAVLAHLGGDAVAQPCDQCAVSKTGGIFGECRVNKVWASNGACSSCGFHGKQGKCSLVDHPAVPTIPSKKRVTFEDLEAEVGTGWYKQDHLTTAVAEKAEEIRALDEEISESPYLNIQAINNDSDEERAEHDFHQAARLIRLRRENKQAAEQLKEALMKTASILNHTNLPIGQASARSCCHADFLEITDSVRNEQEQEAQRARRDSARLQEEEQEEENLRHKPVARNLFGTTTSEAEDIVAQEERRQQHKKEKKQRQKQNKKAQNDAVA